MGVDAIPLGAVSGPPLTSVGLDAKTIVEVSGHTDSVGSDQFNQRLSEQRASAVGNYLIGQGLQRERFEIVGMGEQYPVADNRTDQGRALNRRLEMRVVPLRS